MDSGWTLSVSVLLVIELSLIAYLSVGAEATNAPRWLIP